MSFFDPFPLLSTPRLRLRCLELDDAEIMFENLNTPEAVRFGGKAPPATVAATREKIEKVLATVRAGEGISWALTDIQTGAYLGGAGLWRWDKPNFRAEVGYEISSRVWGRGLMTEAVRAIIAFGFQRMDLHSIEAKVHPENTASIRVLEKLGFQREALFRENHFNGVRFEDTAVYSLLTPG
jgi:ribosomal-protein-alanine N-acetyltransferase